MGFKLFSRCGISGMPYDFLFYVLCRLKVEKSVGFVPADFAMKDNHRSQYYRGCMVRQSPSYANINLPRL
ncbi:hypothetical protein T06_14927 [Trichinella sp. T6]|nr:hypothetical protein T06_14927 [Trichinella sp. T6]